MLNSNNINGSLRLSKEFINIQFLITVPVQSERKGKERPFIYWG